MLSRILVFVCLFLAGAAPAQLPALVKSQQPSSSAPVEGYPTAKAAVEGLIQGVQTGDYDQARLALDLSELNFAIRDVEGTRRAQMAVAVLNRTQGLGSHPYSPSGGIVTIRLRPPGRGEVGRLEFVKRSGWVLSADSVAALPDLWAAMRDSVPVNGFVTEFEGTLDTAQRLRSRVGRHLWHEFLGIELWQWASFAFLLAASWLSGRFLKAAVNKPLRRRLGESGSKALDRLKRGIGWGATGGLWFFALPFLDLPTSVAVPLTLLSKVTLAGAGVFAGIAIVDLTLGLAAGRSKELPKRTDSIYLPILRNFARFVAVTIVAWAFLASLDVNVTGIIAGLGIGGLVLALAAKDSVENVFGSLTILFDMPFGIGDWVKIGNDVNGVVEEINLRSTRVRTFDDSVITVPNSNLTKAAVENFGARRQRRINTTLSLSKADPVAALQFAERLREAMRANPKIRPENAYAYVVAISDSGVSVLVQGYILTNEYEEELQVRQDLVEAIAVLAAESGVEFAPIQWAQPPQPRKV